MRAGMSRADKVMALVDAAADGNWEEVLRLLRAGLRLSLLHDVCALSRPTFAPNRMSSNKPSGALAPSFGSFGVRPRCSMSGLRAVPWRA